jgi:hypothetical protein
MVFGVTGLEGERPEYLQAGGRELSVQDMTEDPSQPPRARRDAKPDWIVGRSGWADRALRSVFQTLSRESG